MTKILKFNEFDNDSILEEKQYILDYTSFFTELKSEFLKESKSLPSIYFLDIILPVDEDYMPYHNLNESIKIDLDNLIMEKAIEYSDLNGELYEGFFDSVISKAKEIGGKAVDATKKIITNLGQLIESAKKFLLAGWTTAVAKSKDIVAKVSGDIKEMFQKKADKVKDLDFKKAKEEAQGITDSSKHALAPKNWAEKLLKYKEGDAKSELQNNIKDSGVDKEDVQQAISKLGDKDEEKKEENENLSTYFKIFNLIKEDKEFLNNLLEYDINKLKENYLNIFELDFIDELSEEDHEKHDEHDNHGKKLSVGKIVEILAGGVVTIISKVVNFGVKGGLSKFTEMVEKYLGGPKATKVVALAFISGAFVEIIADIILPIISKLTGAEWAEAIVHAAHGASGLYLALKVSGLGTIATLACGCYTAYILVNHATHELGGDH